MTISYTTPILPTGSIREKLHYLTTAYLSPFSTPIDRITHSTTYNQHQYHLIHRTYVSCSFVSTVLKVISYFTIVLPALAMIVWYGTQDFSSRFLLDNPSYVNIHHDLLSSSTSLKILYALSPKALQNFAANALRNKDLQALEILCKDYPKSLTDDVLHKIVTDSTYSKIHPIVNPMYLERGKKKPISDSLSDIFYDNKELFLSFITTRDVESYIDHPLYYPCLVKLVYMYMCNCLNTNTPLPDFHHSIFSIHCKLPLHSNNDNLPARIFLLGSPTLFSWLLQNHPTAVTHPTLLQFCCDTVCDLKPINSFGPPNKFTDQHQKFRMLVNHTKGEVYNFCTKEGLSRMRDSTKYAELYTDLISKTNLYPLPDHLQPTPLREL